MLVAIRLQDVTALAHHGVVNGARGSKSFHPLRHVPSARPMSRAPSSRRTFSARASIPGRSAFTAMRRPPLGSTGGPGEASGRGPPRPLGIPPGKEPTKAPTPGAKNDGHVRLVFDQVGEERYLSEVWMPGMDGLLIRATSERHKHESVEGQDK